MQQTPPNKSKQLVVEPIDYLQRGQEQIDCSRPAQAQIDSSQSVEQEDDCEQPVQQEEDCGQSSPYNSPSTQTVLKGLSTIQIVVGFFSMICGSVLLILPSSHDYRGLSHIGYGLWIGGLFVMTGAFGIKAAKKKGLCLQCTTIVPLVLSIMLLTFTSIGLSEVTEYSKRCDRYSCPSKTGYNTFVAMYSMHILIALTKFVVTIWITCLRIKSIGGIVIQSNHLTEEERRKALRDGTQQIMEDMLKTQARHLEISAPAPGSFGAPTAAGMFGAPGAPGAFGAPGASAFSGVFGGHGAPATYSPYQHQQQYSPYSAEAIAQPAGHMITTPAPPSYDSATQ